MTDITKRDIFNTFAAVTSHSLLYVESVYNNNNKPNKNLKKKNNHCKYNLLYINSFVIILTVVAFANKM